MRGEALVLRGVHVKMPDGEASRTILDIPELNLPAGAVVGVRGASGAGKTTLLRLLSGLCIPHARDCELRWGDTDLCRLPEEARDRWRGERVGFIFQDFRLFPTLSVLENVLVPATFRSARVAGEVRAHALDLLHTVGLSRPGQRAESLSRGEQQRVAVARALLFRPSLILADEPTASLDTDNARLVMDTLFAYAAAEEACLWVVSHDLSVLERLPLRLRLERGRVTREGGAARQESPGAPIQSTLARGAA